MDARTLITPERFDLLAKVIYARYHLWQLHSDYHRRLYRTHIRVFNNGIEPADPTKPNDKPRKPNVDAFVQAYDRLITSMQKQGFLPQHAVPIAPNHVCLNGAHRISAAYMLQLPVPTKVRQTRATRYDSDYFLRRKVFVRTGLPRPMADRMALEYTRIHKDATRIITLYPVAPPRYTQAFERLLRQHGTIVYKKASKLNNTGVLNLIKELYFGEGWLAPQRNFRGARAKQRVCVGPHATRFYVFHPRNPTLKAMIALKAKLRALYKLGKHALHINDTPDETRRIARCVLNANSIHFLNRANTAWSPTNKALFDSLYAQHRTFTPEQQDSFMVDSSFVMALYGLRDARDIDFVPSSHTLPTTVQQLSRHPKIDNHTHEWPKFTTTSHPDSVVYDPASHFYYHSIKFLALPLLKRFKQKRNEVKDRRDVQLMKQVGV